MEFPNCIYELIKEYSEPIYKKPKHYYLIKKYLDDTMFYDIIMSKLPIEADYTFTRRYIPSAIKKKTIYYDVIVN
jgi:hypothetical protein